MKYTATIIIIFLSRFIIFAQIEDAESPMFGSTKKVNSFKQTKYTDIKKLKIQQVDLNNAFALDLLNQFQDEETNFFFSPYGISSAMALLYNAAENETKTQIAEVMNFPVNKNKLNADFLKIATNFPPADTSSTLELNVLNSLWTNKSFSYADKFKKDAEKYYKVSVQLVDFQGEPELARKKINAWTAKQTDGKITELFPPQSIRTNTRLVLVNTVFMKAQWMKKFNPKATKPDVFHACSGDITLDFMRNLCDGRFYVDSALQYFELPYYNSELSFVIVMPNDDVELNHFIKNQTIDSLKMYEKQAKSQNVYLMLPRMNIENTIELKRIFSQMGMPNAFSSKADFTAISDNGSGFAVNTILHQSYLNVDEEGTLAVAATGMFGSRGIPKFVRFVANRPFLFFICENKTGSYLFMGKFTGQTK